MDESMSKFIPTLETLMSPDYNPSITPSSFAEKSTPKSLRNTFESLKPRRTMIKSKSTSSSLRNSPLLNRATPPFSPHTNSPIKTKKFLQKHHNQAFLEKTNTPTSAHKWSQGYNHFSGALNHHAVRSSSPSASSTTKTINSISDEDFDNASDMYEEINKENDAAVLIQKMWRGYQARNLNFRVWQRITYVQMIRAQQHIEKLKEEQERQRMVIERHDKVQNLQNQATNQLLKKIAQLEAQIVELNLKIDGPKQSPEQVPTCVHNEFGTQTDIIAVQTPQDDRFPYNRPKLPKDKADAALDVQLLTRPCTLALFRENETPKESFMEINKANDSNDSTIVSISAENISEVSKSDDKAKPPETTENSTT